jgi:hypothetical protein
MIHSYTTMPLPTVAMLVLSGLLAGCSVPTGSAVSDRASNRPVPGADRCAFLPESPMPPWVSGRPDTKDYVGVGQAGWSEEPEQQIRAAEAGARGSLAAEVSVKIHEQLLQTRCEGTCTPEEQFKILLKAESKTKHTLKGAEIKQRWLDRGSCMVWVLATLSRDKVELQRVMMFNLSSPSIEMAGLLVGHLEKVLREDFAVVPADAQLERCALDGAASACQDRADTIFGAVTVSLEKDTVSVDGTLRQRNFRVKGGLRLKDRMVSSFDVTCKARADAKADVQSIDRAAAEACRDKVNQTMTKDLETMG